MRALMHLFLVPPRQAHSTADKPNAGMIFANTKERPISIDGNGGIVALFRTLYRRPSIGNAARTLAESRVAYHVFSEPPTLRTTTYLTRTCLAHPALSTVLRETFSDLCLVPPAARAARVNLAISLPSRKTPQPC